MRGDSIFIKGAREHNLKSIDVEIPRGRFVVITGISGSGKSSLAFDTLYAEGQRRYVESLSTYARQFLGMMEKPDVDYIEGLSPAISIEQRSPAHNPRSTVATVTEIYDYLRLLFARIGVPHCPRCGRPISSQSTDQIVDSILALGTGTRVEILAPVVRGRKGEYKDLLSKIRRRGFVRARIEGKVYELERVPELERYKKHSIEVVVDRLILKPEIRKRLADSVEIALKEGEGVCIAWVDSKEDHIFSEALACTGCGFSYEEISPRLFSFNSPYGACPACSGLGTRREVDADRIVVNPELSILEGAIAPWGEPRGSWLLANLKSLGREYGFDLNTPWGRLPKRAQNVILFGAEEEIPVEYRRWDGSRFQGYERWEGVVPNLVRLYKETESESRREYIERFMAILPCPECHGSRLKPEALSVKIQGLNIWDVTRMSVRRAEGLFSQELSLSEREALIAKEIVKEVVKRLRFLKSVGLDYLTLDRTTESLSGGEEQRVRLATQIGSGLVGVIYILDEPSVGLHQRDNRRLLDTLIQLKSLGNTVVVVEHDKETILSADWVIDLGPGAGEKGGWVVATGPPEAIKRHENSLTGAYLNGRKSIPVPKQRRTPEGRWLVIKKAAANNLKSIDVRIPLGVFVCITGVSGSGKSTLVYDILYQALAQIFYNSKIKPGQHQAILGVDQIDKVVNIDQSPIGRTPRSNPATYTGAFTPIRELFSQVKEARIRGYRPGRFSFNLRGGRCEACEGDGLIRVEMHFLPDVYVPCEVCKGRRYNRETLEIQYKGKSIADVLEMTVTQALQFFENIPPIQRKLQLLHDVGLGYIKLGQPAPTLSGGEAQRVKLARELSKIATGQTLYILDEPTTGLHFEDVRLLLEVLNRLVDRHNTVLVIEHNLEVIKCADWIIDLGPEGGDEGGWVVAEGPPELIASVPSSYTGQFLRKVLNGITGRSQDSTSEVR